MDPELHVPQRTPERTPDQGLPSVEQLPQYMPERAPEAAPERTEQRAEAASRAAELPVAPALPQPVIVPSMQVGDDDADDSSPLVANDDDLIEKEWVDKAKQIITKTRDDPYKREEAISRLQADYLRKRYGKELGSAK